jgi:hypothetical protein
LTLEQFSALVEGGEPKIQAWATAAREAGVDVEAVGLSVLAARDQHLKLEEAQVAAAASQAFFGATAGVTEGQLTSFNSAIGHMVEVIDTVKEAQDEAKAAVEAANEKMLEQAGILREQVDAQRAAADSTFALRDAEDDLAEKVAGANDEMKEADGDLRKVREVLDDVALSAGDVADSTVRVWEEQAKANGTTITAKEKQDLWNASMITNASTLNGPMRDAVLNYAAQVNGIPPEKVSEIKALLDEGKVAEAEAALNGASRTRPALVQAEALTADAEAAINHVARNRTMQIFGVGGGVRVFDSGGNIPAGEAGIVAERRPEFVNGVLVAGPANVTGGAQTAGILSGGGAGSSMGGGNTLVVNISAMDAASFSPAFMQRLANEFEKMQSRTGRVWQRQG